MKALGEREDEMPSPYSGDRGNGSRCEPRGPGWKRDCGDGIGAKGPSDAGPATLGGRQGQNAPSLNVIT